MLFLVNLLLADDPQEISSLVKSYFVWLGTVEP